ncbi:hypothetical protein PRZ48_014322 [Zasmidium cellare]|uniref:Uncharacterized protein n=1 Tax=Zasmidium cellare TaxID=395010 RepID=A0ABR0E195_ZASCE|nr:hypothetical protein PRZ48_014322 [Zasmidium cellare]
MNDYDEITNFEPQSTWLIFSLFFCFVSYKRPATRPKAPIAPAAKTGTAVAGLMAFEDDEEADAEAEDAEALALLLAAEELALALREAELETDEDEAAAAVAEVEARLSDLEDEEASRLAEEL